MSQKEWANNIFRKYRSFRILLMATICLLGLTACFTGAQSQIHKHERFFYSIGGSAAGDLFMSPARVVNFGTSGQPFVNRTIGFSYIGFNLGARFNILTAADQFAFSVQADPDFDLSIVFPVEQGFGGIGNVSVPLLFSMNVGLGANALTKHTSGIFMAGGLEYNLAPVINVANPAPFEESPRSWIYPALKSGLRLKILDMPIEFNVLYAWDVNPVSYEVQGQVVNEPAGFSLRWNMVVLFSNKDN